MQMCAAVKITIQFGYFIDNVCLEYLNNQNVFSRRGSVSLNMRIGGICHNYRLFLSLSNNRKSL